jgi:hypothetical protein
MPIYHFTSDDGETIERVCSMKDIPDGVEQDGKWYKRDAMRTICTHRYQVHDGNGRYYRTRMIESDALSVHPDQIPEAMEDAQRRRVKVQFDAEGTAKFSSRKQMKEYAEAYGFFDRNGGYGDARKGVGKHLEFEGTTA